MKTINAPSGQWLTQADPDTPTPDRIFVTSVSGFGDLEALYRTADEAERASVTAEQEALNAIADNTETPD